jgi:hypothetical protein
VRAVEKGEGARAQAMKALAWRQGRRVSVATRLSAELFGLLIAILFIVTAVQVGRPALGSRGSWIGRWVDTE